MAMAALASTAAAGSDPQAPAAPSARVVRIDAVVTSRGTPTTDLTASDFTLTEDGEARAIETARPRTGPRVFAFLLDEFHVSPGATAAVRDALERFVRETLKPGDHVAILRPMDPLTRIRFTQDPEEALAAIGDFQGRRGDLTPRSAAEERLLGTSPALVRNGRVRVVASALQALLTGVGRMDSRGVVALVSEGFTEPGERARRRIPNLDAIARVATGLDVPVYCFAPAEPAASSPDADRHASPASAGAGLARPDADREADAEGDRERLRSLAERTGGRASFASDTLGAGLERMAADLDASYRLTYREAGPFDGRFHSLELKVAHPDVEVLAPSGRWAPLGDPAARADTGPAPSLPLMSWRSRPVHHSPFAVTWVGLSRGSSGRMRVVATWEPTWGPSWARAGTRAALGRFKAARPDGEIVFETRLAPAFGGGEDDAPPAAIFEAAPGPLELDLTLVDENGRVLDMDSRDVDVPDPDERRARLMEPEILRARTAVEFRALAADPDAAPTPSREFRRTERLIVRVPAYGAGGAPIPVRARLLNPIGQTMRELQPMAKTARDAVAQFELRLAPYAPGTYEIEIIAAGPAGELRARVRFELGG